MKITGMPNTGMASFDQQIITLLEKYGAPGAAVAVSHNGQVIIARGYGLLDANDPNAQMMPANRFRIASASKPITAMAILALIESGQLLLDTNVWNLLSPQYPLLPRRSLAAGVDQITIRHLLNHTAGWDNNVYDPMFQVDQIAQLVGVPAPADRATIIRYMWSHPLAHPPGNQYSYANFHYCLLGRVIEAITGQVYTDYITSEMFSRMNMVSTAQGASYLQGRLPEEVIYFDFPNAPLVASVFPPFNPVPNPYGGFDLENMDAHGGWVSSTPDLLAFMEALFEGHFLQPATMSEVTANRVPTDSSSDHYYGLGWALTTAGTSFNWWHNGSLPGTTSIIVRTTWSDGSDVCWAALVNSRDQKEDINADLDTRMWAAMQTLSSLPDPIFPIPWQARHGLDPNAYQKTFDQLVARGYHLVHIDGCSLNSGAIYAGIWEQSPSPQWQARHDLTADQYQQTFDSLVAQGYRLRRVSGYSLGNEAYYAGIWEQSPGPQWQARHGLTADQYQQTFNQFIAHGYRLVWVNGYSLGNEAYYAGIWEQSPGPQWQARHGLTADQYQQTFDQFVAQGYRLRVVSGYVVDGIDLYAAIWEKGGPIEWEAHHRLTAIEYQEKFNQIVWGKGYQLVATSGYEVGDNVLYAAIWEAPVI